jgi:hypothetical protein
MRLSTAQTKRFYKSFFEMMKKEVLYIWSFILSLLLLFSTIGLLVWKIVPLAASKSFLPLHYNVYFGVDRFGPWYYVFMVPVIGLFIFFLNLFFETKYFKTEKILGRFFAVFSILFQFVLLVATILIVLVNI